MENESSWVYAIEEKELKENSANMVFQKGLPVLLIKKAGEIYAISNKCAHMACTLAGGTLQDFIIKCPCHDWRYDARTGEFLDAKEIKLPVYEWKSSDGKIFINIQEG
ncbi:MAG: Rieske (2Fe-2S) protein [Candidatus Methanoperedens sp.]|nr:Rieske (2Fe-2S) protein [Candidatus Methanoperedens sp.]CAG1001534.1 toluene monooxygenase system ferredoxin subunit [Methanosarcinales archaeon]